ncbi:hypothetical protein M0Q97_09925 [Candidatus Dojkabacteria bacterium]|jgi:hypothetical protein|nr:hypothetical protein [Candidatus Dojkabacteria bacterium]
MDIFPKFIIETDDELGDCLIIAKCTYHSELVTDKLKVKGGGWWSLKNDIFTLFGESHDYKKAQLDDIRNCIKIGNVFMTNMLIEPIVDQFGFSYDTGNEIIILKTKTNL